MDLQKAIDALKVERERVKRAITELEQVQSGDSGSHIGMFPRGRGRKSMGPKDRQEVSRRMKKYWAKRRNNREQAAP